MLDWKNVLGSNSRQRKSLKSRQRKSTANEMNYEQLERREMFAVNVYSDLNNVPNSSYPTSIVEIPGMTTGGIAFSAQTAKGWTLVTEDVSSNRKIHEFNGHNGRKPLEIAHVRDTSGQDWVYFSGVDANLDRELYRLKWGTSQITRVANISSTGSSDPKELTAVNDRLYFSAWNLARGRELWMTDSDTGETKLVADLTPGTGASSNPRELTKLHNRIVFVADSTAYGTEVFINNQSSTWMVRNIGTGATGSDPAGLTVSGDYIYFAATSPVWGREVWKYGGTLTSAVLVADLVRDGSSNPQELTAWNGGLAFTAQKSGSGRELYRYEPTVLNTTFMLKDIMPGIEGSNPQHLTVANGVLYFSAVSPIYGRELWKSHGISSNTVMVKDLNSASSVPQNLIAAGGRLYFSAINASLGRELYRSDGTAETTMLVRDINLGGASSFPSDFAVANTRFFFSALNGMGERELWYSWGTSATTQMLNVFPGTQGSGPFGLTKFGGRTAFLTGYTGNIELYVTTSPNLVTGSVTAIAANNANFSIDVNSLREVGGNLFFLKRSLTGADRVQLWKSDGTVVGTTFVKQIMGTFEVGPIMKATGDSQTGTLLYMFLKSPTGTHSFWKSDGTTVGTSQLNTSTDFRDVRDLTDVNGRLYFVSTVNNVTQLWRSMGSNSTTVSIPNLINPNSFTVKSNQIYFFAEGATSSNFYRIDMTNAPVLIRSNIVGNGPGVNLNGMMYFAARDGNDSEFRVWRSNGTPGVFVLVKPTGATDPSNFRIASGKVFFTASYNTTNPPAVMVTNGTSAGTTTLASSSVGNSATLVATVGNELIYIWGHYTTGFKAWRTNGTLAGTLPIGQINNRFSTIETLSNAVVVGGTLFFGGIDPQFGHELFTWKP